MSNVKQMGLGLVQYSQDYNELLPPAASDSNGWREAVYSYVKSTSVYRCPEDKRDGSKDAPGHLPRSYAVNALCLSVKGKKLTAFSSPATTILAADMRSFDGEDWNMTDAAFLPGTGRKLYAHFPSHAFYDHSPGRLNVLFVDGHVKAMLPMDTLTPTNLWTPDNRLFTGTDSSNAQAILKNAENE